MWGVCRCALRRHRHCKPPPRYVALLTLTRWPHGTACQAALSPAAGPKAALDRGWADMQSDLSREVGLPDRTQLCAQECEPLRGDQVAPNGIHFSCRRSAPASADGVRVISILAARARRKRRLHPAAITSGQNQGTIWYRSGTVGTGGSRPSHIWRSCVLDRHVPVMAPVGSLLTDLAAGPSRTADARGASFCAGRGAGRPWVSCAVVSRRC